MMNHKTAHGHLCPDCGLDYDCSLSECEGDVYVSCEPCVESDMFDASLINGEELDSILAALEG